MSPSPLHDELAIHKLLARYCHLCDDADFKGLVALFDAGGEFVYGPRVSRGEDELLAFFRETQGRPEQRGKHLTLNSVIDVTGDRATALSDFLFLRPVDPAITPAITGRYRDALARVDGSWRFTRREALRVDAVELA